MAKVRTSRERRLDRLLQERQFDLSDQSSEKDYLSWLIYGDIGSGKSYSLRTLPKEMLPLRVYDFDGKALGAIRGSYPKGQATGLRLPSDHTAFDLVTHDLETHQSAKGFPYRTLAIDTGTSMYESIFKWVSHEQGLVIPEEKTLRFDYRPYYHRSHRIFEEFYSTIRLLPCHLVVFYHENIDRDEEGNIVRAGPSLTGQLRERMPARFSEIYHTRVVRNTKDPTQSKYYWITSHQGFYPARTEIPNMPSRLLQDFSLVWATRKGDPPNEPEGE